MRRMRIQSDGEDALIEPKRETRLVVIIMAVLIAILLVMTITFAVLYASKDNDSSHTSKDPKKPGVCTTKKCQSLAKSVLDKMDVKADPCQDFFQYSCGGYLDWAEEDTDVLGYDTADEEDMLFVEAVLTGPTKTDPSYVRKMKTLYSACLDTETIEARGIDYVYTDDYRLDWPTLNSAWEDGTFDLQSVTEKYAGLLTDALFTGEAIIDPFRTDDMQTWAMHGPDFILKKGKVASYEKYYADLAVGLGAERAVAEADAKKVSAFHSKLLEPEGIGEESEANLKESVAWLTLEEMNGAYGYLDWVSVLQQTFSNVNVNIKPTQKIEIEKDYFIQLGKMLKETDNRTIQNSFGFIHAEKTVRDSTKKLMKARKVFDKEPDDEVPRKDFCSEIVDTIYNFGMAKLMAKKRFTKDMKSFMGSMVSDLKMAGREMIEDSNWMADASKRIAIKKLITMGEKIGVPRQNFEDEDLNTMYKYFISKDHDFIAVKLQNKRQLKLWQLRKLNQPIDVASWGESLTRADASYDLEKNEIRFPVGILEPPFVDQDSPNYMNYGGIGVVIGHEIGHGYDTEGFNYDDTGRITNWTTKEDKQAFRDRTKCFIEQYSKFKFTFNGKTFPGSMSASVPEDLADNVGLKMAFKAYRSYEAGRKDFPELSLPLPEHLNLNAHKLFFLTLGQNFCESISPDVQVEPVGGDIDRVTYGRFRVIGPLQNSLEFSKVFGCKVGDYMNPPNKCTLW